MEDQEGFPMTLTEFCIQLSAKDKRVESIGGFEHIEKLEGHTKDTYQAFLARYNDFLNKPM